MSASAIMERNWARLRELQLTPEEEGRLNTYDRWQYARRVRDVERAILTPEPRPVTLAGLPTPDVALRAFEVYVRQRRERWS